MIRDILILGSGSAGLMAALALRRKLPMIRVRVVRSPELGVIGVGEGTTPLFPQFLFRYLGLDRGAFHREAEPTFKLGGRFLNWGPQPHFDYPFEGTYDVQFQGMPRLNAWYSGWDFGNVSLPAALMTRGRAFCRDAQGRPDLAEYYAYHIENVKFVGYLERAARSLGIEITDGKVERTEPGLEGIASLCMATGERLQADLFVDASGFRSELLGQGLQTPLVSFESALFCDRAVIGGWQRGPEPIKPYTTAETMDAGWCWQIEHEHFINRGYVFSSHFISDDNARAELLRKNPAIPPETTRVVKFRSGRRQELWRGNVVAIGNAGGFVEPLEATALTIAAMQLKLLVQTIWHGQFEVTPTLRGAFNRVAANHWDDTRDFLAMHYRYNTARDTPFWRTCREETNLGEVAGFVDFFRENGPSVLAANALPGGRAIYGLDGHFAMLTGQRVPWARMPSHSQAEQATWQRYAEHFKALSANSLDVKETLAALRAPDWRWPQEAGRARTTLQL